MSTKKAKIRVVSENKTGRNTQFEVARRVVSRAKLVKEIKNGQHLGYHVRKINGLDTPVSNPDSNNNNNLG